MTLVEFMASPTPTDLLLESLDWENDEVFTLVNKDQYGLLLIVSVQKYT